MYCKTLFSISIIRRPFLAVWLAWPHLFGQPSHQCVLGFHGGSTQRMHKDSLLILQMRRWKPSDGEQLSRGPTNN